MSQSLATSEQRPIILLSNDDGIHAEGLLALEREVADLGEVWVVAPATEQSGVSSALSLHSPVRIKPFGERRLAVTGTPADCVYMALHHILPRRPALCISGINHGANLGDDVIYSGTVAAAIEATMCDVRSIAISFAAYGKGFDYTPAARIARRVALQALERPLPRGVLLNVNVPRDADEHTPIEICKLGKRNYQQTVHEQRDPRGGRYYWIGGTALDADDLPGSDCNAVSTSKVSLTPVSVDMTHYRSLEQLRGWSL